MHGRAVKTMTPLVLVLIIVLIAAMSAVFSTDSRPGINEPQELWFGRR